MVILKKLTKIIFELFILVAAAVFTAFDKQAVGLSIYGTDKRVR